MVCRRTVVRHYVSCLQSLLGITTRDSAPAGICLKQLSTKILLDFGRFHCPHVTRKITLSRFGPCRDRGRFGAEFLVFGFGLTEYRDIWVRILPSGEEFVIGLAAALMVPLHGIGPRETELRQRSEHFPVVPSAVNDDLLEIGGSLGVLSCGLVSKPTIIKNRWHGI